MDIKLIILGAVFIISVMVYGHYHRQSMKHDHPVATKGGDQLIQAIEEHNNKKGTGENIRNKLGLGSSSLIVNGKRQPRQPQEQRNTGFNRAFTGETSADPNNPSGPVNPTPYATRNHNQQQPQAPVDSYYPPPPLENNAVPAR